MSGNEYSQKNLRKLEVVKEKGIYCYDYMDSMERFDETSLPSKDHLFNRLYDKHLSEEEYTYARRVWRR